MAQCAFYSTAIATYLLFPRQTSPLASAAPLLPLAIVKPACIIPQFFVKTPFFVLNNDTMWQVLCHCTRVRCIAGK